MRDDEMLMPALPSSHDVSALLRAHPDILNRNQPVRTLDIKKLGSGESNVDFLATVDEQERYTIRISGRSEGADNLARAFSRLRSLPEGFGPAAIYLDVSRSLLPLPFSVLSFLPGKPPERWTLDDLRRHGRKLAALHQLPVRGEQGANNAQTNFRPERLPLDMAARFVQRLETERASEHSAVESPLVQRLIPRLTAYFQAQTPLFLALARRSILHGDANASNIVLDGEEVHYIDWEWTTVGDPARDVAQLGWDIANPPWQIALDGEHLAAYLDAYREVYPDATLAARRDAWTVWLKFFGYLGYLQAIDTADTSALGRSSDEYRAVAERVGGSLARQFL